MESVASKRQPNTDESNELYGRGSCDTGVDYINSHAEEREQIKCHPRANGILPG
jgi:hypothetical protein